MVNIRSFLFSFKSTVDDLPPQYGVKNYFTLQRLTFRFMGIDITSEKRTIFQPILTWFPMTLLMLFCSLMLTYAAECREDVNLMTDILAPCCQSMLVLIKMFCFLWNKKKIVKLIRRIWLANLKATGEEFQILLEENERERFSSLLFCRYVLATSVMALSSPFLVAYFYYMQGHGFMDNLELPLKAAYHLVLIPKSYTGYLVAYIWNTFAIWLNFCGAISNDTLFSWLAHNISAQFRILNLRLKTTALTIRLHSDAGESKFLRLLVSHIVYHRHVIELVNYFNDVFTVILFFKYTLSFLEVACLIFQINRASELSILAFHILFLISVSLQLFLYCSGGQKIKDESTAVAVEIYKSFPWHKMGIKSKKLLLLCMMRAEKPCFLTGIFFVADLPLLLWVFKTAGSFFTMLKSVESN